MDSVGSESTEKIIWTPPPKEVTKKDDDTGSIETPSTVATTKKTTATSKQTARFGANDSVVSEDLRFSHLATAGKIAREFTGLERSGLSLSEKPKVNNAAMSALRDSDGMPLDFVASVTETGWLAAFSTANTLAVNKDQLEAIDKIEQGLLDKDKSIFNQKFHADGADQESVVLEYAAKAFLSKANPTEGDKNGFVEAIKLAQSKPGDSEQAKTESQKSAQKALGILLKLEPENRASFAANLPALNNLQNQASAKLGKSIDTAKGFGSDLSTLVAEAWGGVKATVGAKTEDLVQSMPSMKDISFKGMEAIIEGTKPGRQLDPLTVDKFKSIDLSQFEKPEYQAAFAKEVILDKAKSLAADATTTERQEAFRSSLETMSLVQAFAKGELAQYDDKSKAVELEAGAALLANTEGESFEAIASSLVDFSSGQASKEETLANVSNTLQEFRQGNLDPEVKELHQGLVADLIHSGGVDYKQSQLAAKVLDHIPADKKAEAIKFALGLTASNNPLENFQASTDPAKQIVAKAAVDLLKENGMNVDQTARAMNAIMDSDGKVDYDKLAGNIAWFVKNGAPAEIRGRLGGAASLGLDDVAEWSPGHRRNGLFGISGQVHDGMNTRFNNEYWSAQQNLKANEKELQMLHGLLKINGDLDRNNGYGVYQADLESLKGLQSVSASVLDTTSANRITLDQGRSSGGFEVFADKAHDQKFYKLTQPDGSTRYAINTDAEKNEWKFLQGRELSFAGKSYADTVGSFNRKQELSQRPVVFSQVTREDNNPGEFDYYKISENETIALYNGTDSRYSNVAYKKTEGGKFARVESREEAQQYKDARERWSFKPAEKNRFDENYDVYVTNGGSEVAVGRGNNPKTRGLIQVRDSRADKWRSYEPPKKKIQNPQEAVAYSYQTQSNQTRSNNSSNDRFEPRYGRQKYWK